MTQGTILRYATAIVTFLLGGANTLFGAHFQIPTIVGDFTLGATLIVAEILALKQKNWSGAFSDAEELFKVLVPLIEQFVKEIPQKQTSNKD